MQKRMISFGLAVAMVCSVIGLAQAGPLDWLKRVFSCNKVDDPELQTQQLCDNYRRLKHENDVLHQMLIDCPRDSVIEAETDLLMDQLMEEIRSEN